MINYNIKVSLKDSYRLISHNKEKETEILDKIKRATQNYSVSNFSSLKVEENGHGESSYSMYYIDFDIRDNFNGLLEKILDTDYVKNLEITKEEK